MKGKVKRRTRRRREEGREGRRVTTTKEKELRDPFAFLTVSQGPVLNTVYWTQQQVLWPSRPILGSNAWTVPPCKPGESGSPRTGSHTHGASSLAPPARHATESSFCLSGDSGRQPTAPGEETIRERGTPSLSASGCPATMVSIITICSSSTRMKTCVKGKSVNTGEPVKQWGFVIT